MQSQLHQLLLAKALLALLLYYSMQLINCNIL